MKITIFGAAGEVGCRIVAEALSRGHEVKAVVRNETQFPKLPEGVSPCAGDAADSDDVTRLASGQDLVISAIRPPSGEEAQLPIITESILVGVARAGVRVLMVGGAASLKLPGQGDLTVLTAPNFLPASVIDIARACFEQHRVCSANHSADWTLLCPPAMLMPGKRTGNFRLGKDELVVGSDGISKISMEDFAVVMMDEADQPKHPRARFTAAY